MLKLSVLAAFSVAALTVAPLPVITGAAYAQSRCTFTANYCTPDAPATTDSCKNELGHLRRVYEEQLEAIEDPRRVSIVPICIGESYGVMRSDGNAGALRQTIADNDAMMEALFDKNFRYDDVIGIRMTGEESVVLYVHPFHNYR
jgi:hypothetical protein